MNNKIQQAAPLITIIISNLNGSKTLQQCIDSVANQTYKNKELIIIDGNSNDSSVDLLKENDSKITYWISEPDNGIYSAWNKGLLKANGDWLCFLGSDDYFWDKEVLEKASIILNSMPKNINVAYGQIMLLTKSGMPLYKVGRPWVKMKNQYTKYMSIPHPGLLHRSSLFKIHGNFDESFQIAGDYELLLRELKTNDAEFMPIVLAGVRQGGVSCNSFHSLKPLLEVRKAQKKNGIYIPSFFWMASFARLLFRRALSLIFGESRARIFFDFGRRIVGLPEYWTKT
jgi:glycosyltransferase involved in cell wall biosynthesis